MDTKEQVAEFEKLEQQLHSFLREVSELSRKKPNDPLNKFKLKFINSSLSALNKILGTAAPFEDFQQFDIDDLPSNSDVVMILSQYSAAIRRFRSDNIIKKDYKWWWLIKNKASNLEAPEPQTFK